MKAVILAGGFGTRLKTIASDIPQSMIFVAGKPLLEHQLIFLKEHGIKEIIITIYHMGNIIKSYFGDGSRWELDITYSEEEIPLGTAGAIKNAEKYIDDSFIVLNGNSYSHIDLKEFSEFHKIKKNIGTIALTEAKETAEYGNVILQDNKVIEFLEKEVINEKENLVSSGVYIFEPAIFDYIEPYKNVSLEREIFPKLARERVLGGYRYGEYFMDITRPETYQKFKKDVLKSLFLKEDEILKKAMHKISKSGIDLVLIVDDNEKLLGVINDRIIKKYLLQGGNIEGKISEAMIRNPEKIANINDDKEKIYNLLLDSRHVPVLDENGKIVDVEFRVDKIKIENFPVIRGKSPLRISFAGGGTDLPHFFEKFGGVVINCTIDKYCYATIIKRADSKIIINSDLEEEIIIDSKNMVYDGKFDLIKAIIKIMNLDFGFELYMHNDIPPGRGLGSSASLAVLVVKLISILQDVAYDDYKIAEIAYRAETEELKIKGGWQDQYAAVTGGFNFMEFNGEKTIIYPLRLKDEIINEFNHHLLLCYVGKNHFSGELQEKLTKNIQSEEDVLKSMSELKKIAVEIKDSLLTNNLEEIGKLLHKSWENKKRVSNSISNPKIDRLYEVALQNGAYGGKLLGAGGGGYLLFFYSPKKRNKLVKALLEEGGEIMNFNFEFNGAKIWIMQNKKFYA